MISSILPLFCLLFVGNSFGDLDTVTSIGQCNGQNTVGNESKTPEELGQKLLQNIEPQLQKMQHEGDTVNVLDGMVRNMCQLLLPYGKGHENVMPQVDGPQNAKFGQQVAQMCCDLQQNRARHATTQQIYAVELKRIADAFGGQKNVIKMLDKVEHQIVGQLKKQEEQKSSDGKISGDWDDKLSEFASKLEDKNLAQNLKMLMAERKPSELLALSYELIMDKIHHPADQHRRRAKRNQAFGWAILLGLCCLCPPLLVVVIACMFINIGIQGR